MDKGCLHIESGDTGDRDADKLSGFERVGGAVDHHETIHIGSLQRRSSESQIPR
jgi:hypothetical protein